MSLSSVDCNMKAEVTSSFSFLARFNVDAHYLLSRFRWYFFLFRMTKRSYFLSLGGQRPWWSFLSMTLEMSLVFFNDVDGLTQVVFAQGSFMLEAWWIYGIKWYDLEGLCSRELYAGGMVDMRQKIVWNTWTLICLEINNIQWIGVQTFMAIFQ